MNKKNKILLGCLALLLVLSVGYALFSETIEINGTATAKGSFDITESCELGDTYNILGKIEGGYGNDKCAIVDNVVTFSTELYYPTANRSFTVYLENTGTINAVIDLENDILIETLARCPLINGEFNNSCDFNYDDFFNPIHNDITIDGIIRNGVFTPFTDETIIIVKPGEVLVSAVNFVWNENRSKPKHNGVTYGFQFGITYNFNQETAQ